MSTNKRSQDGFTLIEIIVTVAIMSIVGWMLSNYMSRAQKLEAQQAAQDAAHQSKKYISDLLRRDLAFVTDPALVVVTSLHDMSITRPKIQGNNRPDPTQTYRVRYSAQCVAIPSSLQSQMASINFSSLSTQLQARSSCVPMATLKCGPGTYPQIRIDPDPGANLPVYQRRRIPDLQSKTPIYQSPVGALPCFQRNGKQITLALDLFYLRNAGTVSLELVGEKFFMLIGNVSDMNIYQE